jgi:hypothetical protein
MRRSVLTIGILTAELAVGALAAAPPAAADDTTPADAPPSGDPAPAPLDPLAVIRTGRAIDLPALPQLPVQLPRLPLALGDDGGAPSSPTSEPNIPAPEAPAPSSPPPAEASSAPSPASPIPDPAVPTGTAPVPAASRPPAHWVIAGDSLWEIAAHQLATASGRDRATLPAAEIAGYWVRVCEANRGHLQSGDLNVIYAGEVVALPPI